MVFSLVAGQLCGFNSVYLQKNVTVEYLAEGFLPAVIKID